MAKSGRNTEAPARTAATRRVAPTWAWFVTSGRGDPVSRPRPKRAAGHLNPTGFAVQSASASVILLLLVVAGWSVFSWALVARHRAYRSAAFDLGFFDQIVWNTAHGRWFETTFVPYNFLGQHVEPVLLLFAAVYRVHANVEILLLTQAAVAAWAAVPLYLAARQVLRSAVAGLLVAAAYLLAPHLHGAVLFDFHPEVMGTAGIFGAFALLVAGRPGWSLAALGSVFLLKEDAALVGLGFALIVWLHGYRRHGLALLGASLVYAVIVLGAVMPAVRGGPGDLQERYGYLGTDTRGIVSGALRRPDVVLRHLLERGPRRGLAHLLATQALVPVVTPAALAAAPLLAANMLTTHPPQNELTLHYPVLPFALLLVASVSGARWLAHAPRTARLWRRLRLAPAHRGTALAAVLLAAQAVGWLTGSPLGGRFDPEQFRRTAHAGAVDWVVSAVPAGVPLSAQSGLLPHLSRRRDVWEFPRLEGATHVVIDRKAWRSSQSIDTGYTRVLDALPSLGYCLLMEEDGVELYARRDDRGPC